MTDHPGVNPAPAVGKLWPPGVRIVVVLTFLMENWSEGKAPPYSPMTSPPKPGAIDRAGIKWADYGGKSGIARLLRIARKHGVYATVCANGRSAELFPDTIAHIVNSGFELAGHNYVQDGVLSGLNETEERAVIQKSLAVLENVSGVRPVGWLSSTIATTDRTADLLCQEGLLWHGDYNDIDLPFRVATDSGSIVAIPHSDYADNRVLRGAPMDWYQCYKDMFDFLYQDEPESFINITMHGNFGGRPLLAALLDKLLVYIKGHPGVWMPRHDELAHWVNEREIHEVGYLARFPM